MVNRNRHESEDLIDEILNNPDLDHIPESDMNVEDILNEDEDDMLSSYSSKKNKTKDASSKGSGMPKGSEYSGLHPLDAIEKQEREISELDFPDLQSKFVLSNSQQKERKKTSNILYSRLETINSYLYPGHEERSYGNLGNPRSLTVATGRYIVVGTHYCVACVFDYNQGKLRKFGTSKEYEYGPITAMDIDSDRECLLCGYEKGQIVMWDLNAGTVMKSIVGAHDTAILSLKFWRDGKTHIISSDSNGNVLLIQVNKALFNYSVDKSVLLDGSAGPVCDIKIARKEIHRTPNLKNCVLAALVSPQMVLVVTLEPVVGIVFRSERPNNLRPGIIPSCGWGVGTTPDVPNNTDPLFAMSWGSKLQLFRVNNINEEEGKGFKPFGYYNSDYESQNEIIYTGFISKDLIVVVDTNKEVKILFTGFLKTSDNDSRKIESDKKAVIDSQLVDPDLLFQVLKDEQGKGRSFFQNTIFTIDATRRIFLLARQSLYVGKLSTWEEHIKALINKGDWTGALSACLDIYKGSNRMFAEIPTDEKECRKIMKPFFREVITDYINFFGSHIDRAKDNPVSKTNKLWEDVILTTIDFLVSSENFPFLFNEIRNAFTKYGQSEIFIHNLEPFILRNRITYIPNEPFRDIVNYYSQKGKSTVLEHLIINLDISSIDVGLTISLCMEHELLTGLLYICTHIENPDYLTPLTKMYGIYQVKAREGSPDAKNAGHKCLWYIRLIFQGRKFPKGTIDLEEWRIAIQNLVIWLFTDEILLGLFEIDPPVFFEVLALLFKGDLAKLLEDMHRELEVSEHTDKIYIFNQVKNNQDEKYTKIIEKDKAKGFSKILLQMLEASYSCCVNIPTLKYSLAVFMGGIIVEKKYPLKPEVCKKMIETLLQTQSLKLEDKSHGAVIEGSEEWEALIDSRSQMLLEFIKNCEKFLKKEEFDELSTLAASSQYLEVKRYLIELKGDYKKCFEFYMGQPVNLKKKNLFPWLIDVLPKVKGPPKKPEFDLLKTMILNSLRELVTLDSEKTREILLLMDKALESTAIKFLEQSPNLQLSFLEKILQKRGPGSQISDDLLVLHIQLLCKLEPKKVIVELKHFDYPLDPCLKLCKAYQVNDAFAFLLEKSGAIREALDVHLKMLKKSLESKIKKIERGERFDEGGLKNRLDSALHICISNNKYEDPDSELLWFFLLDSMLELYSGFFLPKLNSPQFKDFTKAGSRYIRTIFDKMTMNVALSSILDKIQKSYVAVNLGVLKKSLLDMLSNYHYESDIMVDAKNLMMDDMIDILLKTSLLSVHGIYLERMGVDIDLIGQVAVFECSHTYPKNYVAPTPDVRLDNIECPICSRLEENKILKSCWNFKSGASVMTTKPTKNVPNTETIPDRSINTDTTTEAQSQPSYKVSLSQTQVKFSPSELKDQMFRKMKLFDQKKEDEASHLDGYKDVFDF